MTIEELVIMAKMLYVHILSKIHLVICLDTGEEMVEEKSVLELMKEEGETN